MVSFIVVFSGLIIGYSINSNNDKIHVINSIGDQTEITQIIQDDIGYNTSTKETSQIVIEK